MLYNIWLASSVKQCRPTKLCSIVKILEILLLKTIYKKQLIYLFMNRHEAHSMNTHSAACRLIKTELSTRHWSRQNHSVTDTFCNCIEDRTI